MADDQEREQEVFFVHARTSPKLQLDLPSGRVRAENGLFHLNAEQLAELQAELKRAPSMAALVRLVDREKAAEIAKAAAANFRPQALKGPVTTATLIEETAILQSATNPEILPDIASVKPQEVPVSVPAPKPLPEIKSSRLAQLGGAKVK